jgi:hypothetical protein
VTEAFAGLPLASFFDVHGHRVTATAAGERAAMLVILTATAEGGAVGGHPCLDRPQAAVLRDALTEFIDGAAL